MKKKILAFVLLTLTLSASSFACPDHVKHGPLHGAVNDLSAIGRSFGAAGKHTGQNVVRAGKGIVHFGKWLVS